MTGSSYYTLRNNDRIQLTIILTVGSSPGRGMRLNLPFATVPLRHTDNGYWIFQSPAAYLGDEQMLRILDRGHSVPTVTELIFVRAQCINHFDGRVPDSVFFSQMFNDIGEDTGDGVFSM